MWDEDIEAIDKSARGPKGGRRGQGAERGPKERRVKTAQQALSSLMALCAKGERSTGDAKRLMTRWGVERQEQGAVLERLLEDRFIDDSRYAAAYVREKTRLSGWGVYKLRAQLLQKGVASDIIDAELEALQGAEQREEMTERLEERLRRRLRTVKYKSRYELRDKLIRYGAGLGYDFGSVSEAVAAVLEGVDGEIRGKEEEEDIIF